MMADTKAFNFELVSPEKKLISEPAAMVVIPGVEGDFGVLPGHMALLAAARPGVVSIWTTREGAPERIFIAGGFADVTPESCTLLAEQAVNVNDLNQGEIEQELRNLHEDLGMAKDEAAKADVQSKIVLAQAKLSAVTGHAAAH